MKNVSSKWILMHSLRKNKMYRPFPLLFSVWIEMGAVGLFQCAAFTVRPLSPDTDNRKYLSMGSEDLRRIAMLEGRSEIRVTVVPFISSRNHFKCKGRLSHAWLWAQFSFLCLFVQILPFCGGGSKNRNSWLKEGGGARTKSLESEFFPLTGIMSELLFPLPLWPQVAAMF